MRERNAHKEDTTSEEYKARVRAHIEARKSLKEEKLLKDLSTEGTNHQRKRFDRLLSEVATECGSLKAFIGFFVKSEAGNKAIQNVSKGFIDRSYSNLEVTLPKNSHTMH